MGKQQSSTTYTIQLRSGTVAEYVVRKSRRAKRSSLTLYPDGRLVATIPWFRTHLAALRLVQKQCDWIERHLRKLQKNPSVQLERISAKDKKEYRERAYCMLQERIAHYAHAYDFCYNTIRVKEMCSQWGSCSPKGNLNFNIKIILLPQELQEYIVVHELCHLKEMNHGKQFWSLVESILPDYVEREKHLNTYVIG